MLIQHIFFELSISLVRGLQDNCSTICETSPLIGFIVNNHSITHTYVRISKLTKACNIRITKNDFAIYYYDEADFNKGGFMNIFRLLRKW